MHHLRMQISVHSSRDMLLMLASKLVWRNSPNFKHKWCRGLTSKETCFQIRSLGASGQPHCSEVLRGKCLCQCSFQSFPLPFNPTAFRQRMASPGRFRRLLAFGALLAFGLATASRSRGFTSSYFVWFEDQRLKACRLAVLIEHLEAHCSCDQVLVQEMVPQSQIKAFISMSASPCGGSAVMPYGSR